MKPRDFETAPKLTNALNEAAQRKQDASSDLITTYGDHFDGSAISEAQQQEFLESLFMILSGFVEMGFGADPFQLACGELEISMEDADSAPSDMVKERSPTKTFEERAKPDAGPSPNERESP